jgi:hypothetical protein
MQDLLYTSGCTIVGKYAGPKRKNAKQDIAGIAPRRTLRKTRFIFEVFEAFQAVIVA